MRWITRLRLALRDLIRRDEFERQMDEELRTFVELDADARVSQGASRTEAQRLARAGVPLESTKEHLRGIRSGNVLQTIGQDLRFGLRLLRRQPSFAAAVIVTIALGIGPLTIVLGVTNWLFVRPAPGVRHNADLVQVEFVTRSRGGIGRASMSYLNYQELMSSIRVFDGLAGEAPTGLSVATASAPARRVTARFVMHDYFKILGVSLHSGRAFVADEDREPDGAPVAILSYTLATGLFGDAAQAIGRQMSINGLPFTAVGVASREFTGLQPGLPSDLWLTGSTWAHVSHVPADRRNRGRANGLFNVFIGRLAPNVTLGQAQAELTRATRGLAQAHPEDNDKFTTADVWMERRPGLPIRLRSQTAQLVATLGLVGALLLVIAAANVANLLLFHAVRRRDEIAVRLALGATRWRIVRAHLLDSVLLAVLGGACGLLLAFWSGQFVEGLVLPGVGLISVPIDWRVVVQAIVICAAVACIFGVLPAMTASRPRANGVLRPGSTATTRRPYLRNAFTAIQLALSLTLLVAALLLVSTIRNLSGVDTGTDSSRVTAMVVSLGDLGYSRDRAQMFFARLLERAKTTTAGGTLSVSSQAPFFGATNIARVHMPLDDAAPAIDVASNGVTPEYFSVLGVALLRGRGFTMAEAFPAPDGVCGPVIVSASLARRLFGDQDAVGRTVTLPRNANQPRLECPIVGIVADVRWNGPASEPEPMLYRPFGRDPLSALSGSAVILARSDAPVALVAAALRKAAASIDPTVPLSAEVRLSEAIDRRLADRWLTSTLLTVLAVVGFLLAAAGLSGLVAETVAERRREFGIRMAVGADASRIFWTVVSSAGWLALAGIAAGIPAAIVVSRALRTQLFGVTPLDPLVYTLSAALLIIVVLVASAIPARAVMRVDPVAALKAE